MYVKKVTKTYNRSTLAGKPDEMFVIEISESWRPGLCSRKQLQQIVSVNLNLRKSKDGNSEFQFLVPERMIRILSASSDWLH